jgi:Zn-finger nucleic acid-binding protein
MSGICNKEVPPMQCPVDGTTLVMADRAGVEIDYCPQCRGVWLDRGELDKIIERSAPEAAPPPPPRAEARGHGYDERGRGYDDDPYRGKKKKRGGFLEDLFDF